VLQKVYTNLNIAKLHGLFDSVVDYLKSDSSCELWESCCVVTVMEKLKSV
jgi:hypothetical protein